MLNVVKIQMLALSQNPRLHPGLNASFAMFPLLRAHDGIRSLVHTHKCSVAFVCCCQNCLTGCLCCQLQYFGFGFGLKHIWMSLTSLYLEKNDGNKRSKVC